GPDRLRTRPVIAPAFGGVTLPASPPDAVRLGPIRDVVGSGGEHLGVLHGFCRGWRAPRPQVHRAIHVAVGERHTGRARSAARTRRPRMICWPPTAQRTARMGGSPVVYIQT